MLTKADFESDLHQAMRAKDDLRKRTLRMVLSALKLAEVEKGEPLDEPELLRILQKEVKSRQETIEEAEKAGREDIIAASQEEIELLESYLPEPLTEAELTDMVQSTIEEIGAKDPGDMGAVMKALMPQIQGRADGKTASELVRNALQQK
jgi:uncharacterized protein YqeY